MSIAQDILMRNRRVIRPIGKSEYDIDRLMSDASDHCTEQWHYGDLGVSEFSFPDGSRLQVFHVVVTASDEPDPEDPAEQLVGVQSAPEKANGRVSLLQSLTKALGRSA